MTSHNRHQNAFDVTPGSCVAPRRSRALLGAPRLSLVLLGFGSFVHSILLFKLGLLHRMLTASVAWRIAGSSGNFPRISNFMGGTAPPCLSQACLYITDFCLNSSLLSLISLRCSSNLSPVLLAVSPSYLVSLHRSSSHDIW